MKEFNFDEVKHVYTLDGKRLYGVTTVLNVISKPALIQWAVNIAVEHISKNFPTVETLLGNPYAITDVLEEAKVAHRKKKDDAATKGTDIHAILEDIIKLAIEVNSGFIVNKHTDEPQVQKFIDWATSENIQFIASELRLYSEEMWLAGTVDFTFIKDGKNYVGDIKTTSGIYDRTPFMQVAAYEMMLDERNFGDNYAGRCIVRLGKDGSFEVVYSTSDLDKKGFLAALELFKCLEVPVTPKQKVIKKAINKKKYAKN